MNGNPFGCYFRIFLTHCVLVANRSFSPHLLKSPLYFCFRPSCSLFSREMYVGQSRRDRINITIHFDILFYCYYSLISMRQIYYFDTWAIIWHSIVCWFMVFSLFLPVLVCCDYKIVLHWYENQNKNNLVIMLRKSWKILWNHQKSTNNFMSNSGYHIEL